MVSFSSWNGVKIARQQEPADRRAQGPDGLRGLRRRRLERPSARSPAAPPATARQAINAGLDMFMAPDSWKGALRQHARRGEVRRDPHGAPRRRRAADPAGQGEGRPVRRAAAARRPLRRACGAPDHRALARQAVRESLVLLKNNGGVLPIKASARVLVAGDGADNIAKQCGGWTITWQGTGNTNNDFPHGQSIWSAVVRGACAPAAARPSSRSTGATSRSPTSPSWSSARTPTRSSRATSPPSPTAPATRATSTC